MGEGVPVWRRTSSRKREATLSPESEARFARRMSILLGLVPLPQLSQDETDWVFAQKVRLAGE
jgi:hypothetical protein